MTAPMRRVARGLVLAVMVTLTVAFTTATADATCTVADDGGYWAQEIDCPAPEPQPAAPTIAQLEQTGVADDALTAALVLGGFAVLAGLVLLGVSRNGGES